MNDPLSRLEALDLPTVPFPEGGAARARAGGEHRRRRVRTTRALAVSVVMLVAVVGVVALAARPGRESVQVGGDGAGSTSIGVPSGGVPRWERMAAFAGTAFVGGNVYVPSYWTGSEMLVVGGRSDDSQHLGPLFAVDPVGRTARATAAPTTVGGDNDTLRSTWTGKELVIAGLDANATPVGEGASRPPAIEAYDPVTDVWRLVPIPDVGAAFANIFSIAGGAGRLYVVAGDALWQSDDDLRSWRRLDPPAGSTTDIRRAGLGWDGTELVVVPSSAAEVTWAFDPATERWRERGTGGALGSAGPVGVLSWRAPLTQGAATSADKGVVVGDARNVRFAALRQEKTEWDTFGLSSPDRTFSSIVVGPDRVWRWGVRTFDSSPASAPPRYSLEGEAVDLRTGGTEAMTPFPDGFFGGGGVWSGTELLVWGAEMPPGTSLDARGVEPDSWAVYRLVESPRTTATNPPSASGSGPLTSGGSIPATATAATTPRTGSKDCQGSFGAGRPDGAAYQARLDAVVDVVSAWAPVTCADDRSTFSQPAMSLELDTGLFVELRYVGVRGADSLLAAWGAAVGSDPQSISEVQIANRRGGERVLIRGSAEGRSVSAWATDGNDPSAEVIVTVGTSSNSSETSEAAELAAGIASDLVHKVASTWREVPMVFAVPPSADPLVGGSGPASTGAEALVQGTIGVGSFPGGKCVQLDGKAIVFPTGSYWSIDEQAMIGPTGPPIRPGEVFRSVGGYYPIDGLSAVLTAVSGRGEGDGPSWVATAVGRCATASDQVALVG